MGRWKKTDGLEETGGIWLGPEPERKVVWATAHHLLQIRCEPWRLEKASSTPCLGHIPNKHSFTQCFPSTSMCQTLYVWHSFTCLLVFNFRHSLCDLHISLMLIVIESSMTKPRVAELVWHKSLVSKTVPPG